LSQARPSTSLILPQFNSRVFPCGPHLPTHVMSHMSTFFYNCTQPWFMYWDGMVGHSSKNRCRLYCSIPGRRKEHAHHYYPALLCPHDQVPDKSNHSDINVFSITSGGSLDYWPNLEKIVSVSNQTQWNNMKMETRLTKPPLMYSWPQACLLTWDFTLHEDRYYTLDREYFRSSHFPLA